MVFNPQKRAVGLFPSMEKSAVALCDLKSAGFPMKNISAIARKRNRIREINPNSMEIKTLDNQVPATGLAGVLTGGSLGMVLGLLVSLSILALSGIGPVILAGVEAATVGTVIVGGGAIGAATGGIVGHLMTYGMSSDRAHCYWERVIQGDYLLILTGSDREIALASRILNARGIQEWEIHERSPRRSTLLCD
ncbi:hypothetical protein J0895_09845 [Phormidium pseudopriestleyi FRX01]|uniref:DUF1269 domain-containing protein n=1 Tax=Phormidium pseudopriestleyi FRX01 TaxID=1759528 RepID=A0ABS3FQK7_9CYAN|nr:hypothetical protein [Phormidium pseudopriestleyi]MBO0349402.1 hypothetical protein [Phormidium pseudopriestleyi FRX01]